VTDPTRLRALAAPIALALLVPVVLLARPGALGVALFAVLLLALLLTVGAHLRLQPLRGHRSPPGGPPLLQTPTQVGLGLAVVVVGGSLVAIVVSLLLSTLVKPLAGDGNGLLRVSLAVFALGPCVSIGYRCGRWWAFAGSAALAPLLGLCVLIVGPRTWSGAGFVLLAVAAVALAVAAGSLRRELTGTRATRRARRSTAAVAAQPQRRARPATGSSESSKRVSASP
jgi:hypothetical protein